MTAFEIDPDGQDAGALTALIRHLTRLAGLPWEGSRGEHESIVREALRQFLIPPPPKPEEPLGVGALVEDRAGVQWLRVTSGPTRAWAPLGSVRIFDRWRDYADIAVVRVLEEGHVE